MNRAQRRALAKSEDAKTKAVAQQEKALMEPARMGHIMFLQGEIEEMKRYLQQKFPKDFEERSEGGVIRAKGFVGGVESGTKGSP